MWKFKDGNYADIYVSDEFKYLRSSGIIGRINTLLNFIRRGNYCRGDVGLNKSQLIQIRDWCDKIINLSEHDDKEMLDL